MITKYAGIITNALGLGAAGLGAASDVAGSVAQKGMLALAAAPWMAGAGAGALHSSITSPTKTDYDTMQRMITKNELEELEATISRLSIRRKLREAKKKKDKKAWAKKRTVI